MTSKAGMISLWLFQEQDTGEHSANMFWCDMFSVRAFEWISGVEN